MHVQAQSRPPTTLSPHLYCGWCWLSRKIQPFPRLTDDSVGLSVTGNTMPCSLHQLLRKFPKLTQTLQSPQHDIFYHIRTAGPAILQRYLWLDPTKRLMAPTLCVVRWTVHSCVLYQYVMPGSEAVFRVIEVKIHDAFSVSCSQRMFYQARKI